MYIGKSPQTGAYSILDSLTASSTASYVMQLNSVNYTPESAQHLIVSLNGSIQKPNSSFTCSGSTLTFSEALTSSDSIDFIYALGNVLDVGTVSDATITNAKTNFVSTSSASGLQIKGDGTTDGTLQLNCSQNSHGIKLKSPPHSASASYTLTFPNDDGTSGQALTTNGSGVLTWANAGGTNTPSFSAYKDSADQSLSGGGDVKVQYETEIFDSNGKYANYRFTPTVSGKYFFMASAFVDTTGGVGTLSVAGLKMKKNGTTAAKQRSTFDNNPIRTMTQQISCILDLDTDDYVEVFAHGETTSGNAVVRRENIEGSNFIGFKLIT